MGPRLTDKVCIITGASRGIGAASARLFASEGARVVLVDLKNELGEATATEIRKQGGEARYFHADVTKLADIRHFVDATLSEFGTIDVLFNNAGTAIQGRVDTLSEEDWDLTFNTNVKSMFLCSKVVVPVMKKAGKGNIVNQASVSGIIGFPMHPAYCASKAAVINLTRSMAVAHAEDNIRVNCICPGVIPTPLYHEFMSSLPDKDAVIESLTKAHPLGLGTEQDIAFAALFLASEESRYMTGAPLIVDGGFTAI